MENAVYTVGHSTHTIEHFIDILKQNGVNVVADVRSSPYSRFNPQFNREALADSLREHGIKYVFLGEEFGARSSDRSCYIDSYDGRADGGNGVLDGRLPGIGNRLID